MIHFPVVHMILFGILKAASKSQIAAILPEPLHASICKLGRVWEMSSTVAQRGTVTPVLTHTYTHTLHLAAIAFFFASYESHWLLKQDNCVNLLQNCLCLCSWITGAWVFFIFFFIHGCWQATGAQHVSEMAGCTGQHLFPSGIPADRPCRRT